MVSTYTTHQGAWYVAREDFKNHRVEYLDNDRDLFYVEGVLGYPNRGEANARALKFEGDKRQLFLIGPSYGRYRLANHSKMQALHQPKNTQLARFLMVDRILEKESSPELIDELRANMRDFALTHGVWKFSNQMKTRDFLRLCRKYNALTEFDLVRMIYE